MVPEIDDLANLYPRRAVKADLSACRTYRKWWTGSMIPRWRVAGGRSDPSPIINLSAGCRRFSVLGPGAPQEAAAELKNALADFKTADPF
jgi:hypothetical protein